MRTPFTVPVASPPSARDSILVIRSFDDLRGERREGAVRRPVHERRGAQQGWRQGERRCHPSRQVDVQVRSAGLGRPVLRLGATGRNGPRSGKRSDAVGRRVARGVRRRRRGRRRVLPRLSRAGGFWSDGHHGRLERGACPKVIVRTNKNTNEAKISKLCMTLCISPTSPNHAIAKCSVMSPARRSFTGSFTG